MHSDGVGCGSTFYIKLPVYLSSQLIHNNNNNTTNNNNNNNSALSSSFMNISPSNIGIKNLSVEINSNENSSVDDDKMLTPEEISEELKRNKVFLGLKVLIVDDASMIRKLMTKLLSSKGSICDTAEDGVYAVEIMKKYYNQQKENEPKDEKNNNKNNNKNYDIIFMDFMMPNKDGPQATREIRSLGYKGLIIGVTGNMMPSDVEYFMNAGANIILPKPLSLESLQDYLMKEFHHSLF